MKRSKKYHFVLSGIFGIVLCGLCMFCILWNIPSSDNNDQESTEKTIDNTKLIFQNNPLVCTPQEQNTFSNQINYINNNKYKPNTIDEKKYKRTEKETEITYDNLWTDDNLCVPQVKTYKNGTILYYKYNVKDDDTYELIISDKDLGAKSFDSANAAPWVNDKTIPQYKISEVTLQSDTTIKPSNTIGWFGCQTEYKERTNLSKIRTINNLDKLDMSYVKDAAYMFCGSNAFTSSPEASTFFETMTAVENAAGICNYTNLDNTFLNKIANAIAPTATNTSFAFAHNFDNLDTFDIHESETSCNVSNSSYMFYQDKSISLILANKLISSNITSVERMFYDCNNLKSIYLNLGSNWSNLEASKCKEIFKYCWCLKGGNGTIYDKNKYDQTYAKIDGESSNIGYFTAVTTYKLTTDGNGVWKDENLVEVTSFTSIDLLRPELIEDNTAVRYTNIYGNVCTVKVKPSTSEYRFLSSSYDVETMSYIALFKLWQPNPLDVDGFHYFPLPGSSLQDDVIFFDQNKEEIQKTGGTRYQLSDLKNAYYYDCPTPSSFKAVRNISGFQYGDLYSARDWGNQQPNQGFIDKYLKNGENIERLADTNKLIDNIDLADIKNTYFEDAINYYPSCYIYCPIGANIVWGYVYSCNPKGWDSWDLTSGRFPTDPLSVCVSRFFS